jgi:glutamate formiminotransferase/formiminotetrahydrofolate cyclodeaminase
MSGQLIECIPNFSEARNPDVVKEIRFAIESVPNVQILDLHSDDDHNRTVVTYIGQPDSVSEAAFLAIKKASELINMDQHEGSHPRMGATDVVPFIPISGVSMAECIILARQLGERVGKELDIPVYLYEEAATLPERKNLENVRRGEYELLKKEIQTNNLRVPDFGPSIIKPAGATIIGARNPLIAFNVYLDSDDLYKAKTIAKAIRESSGGLAYVKALGMMVNGSAQVSMNLTNYHKTSILQVVEAIRIQAAKFNTRIHHSELVGLIPQDALLETAISYLQLDGFNEDQILENRLISAKSERAIVDTDILENFASGDPTPGGGSAAAYSGAMAAALVSMVARLTIGKKKYASVEAQMEEILLQSEKIRSQLTSLVQQDATAFENVMTAFKLPKDSRELEVIRSKAIEDATLAATMVPMQVAQFSGTILALSERVVSLGNINAISDGGSAGALAIASIKSASYNVRINLANLSDAIKRESLEMQMEQIEKRSKTIESKLLNSLHERGSI